MRTRISWVVVLVIAMTCLPGNVWAESGSANTLARSADPVIMTGDQMVLFRGVALDQLFLFVYQNGSWQQIPWQFDEMDQYGNYLPTGDGNLNDTDQLVFMAADCGGKSPALSWISDADSQNYQRYEIHVIDPLDATEGWAYLYRSQTLAETVTDDYASYDATDALFTAEQYLMGLMTDEAGVDRLEMFGSGVDIIDRTKLRARVEFVGELTEETLFSITRPYTLRDGRVRAITKATALGATMTTVVYRSMAIVTVAMDLMPFGVSLSSSRLSVDMSPAAAGSTYYDANAPEGVPIDGVADALPVTPMSDWRQISGSTGTVVAIADTRGVSGVFTNYYKDDSSFDLGDTGDKVSYSDSGGQVSSPGKQLTVNLSYYVLPANQPAIGETYRDQAFNPLQTETTAQDYSAATVHSVALPLLFKN